MLPEQYVLFIWSEYGRKNLKNAIAAFAIVKQKFPNLVFVKAPAQLGILREKTVSYVVESGLEAWKDVMFIDEYLSHEQCAELYSGARLFLFPSLSEWFGFPIIEAQSCGCPVITTNYWPMNELVPYTELTVDPNNPEDIAEKMLKVLEDDNLRTQIIEDWRMFSQKFSWENTAKGFDTLIKSF